MKQKKASATKTKYNVAGCVTGCDVIEKIARLGSWRMNVPDGNFTISKELVNITGIDPSNSSFEYYRNLVHPDDRSGSDEFFRKMIEGSSVASVDFRMRRPDTGEEKYLSVSAQFVRGNGGEVVEIVGTAVDITERKRIEEALLDTEMRLNRIVENVDAGIWSVSPTTFKLQYASPVYEKIYGRAIREFFDNDRLWLEVIHEDDRAEVERVFGGVARSGSAECEYRIKRPDGGVRWVHDRCSMVYDETGMPTRIDGIVTDISIRKIIENELAESEGRYRQLFNAVNDAVFTIDRDSVTIIDANQKAAVMYDYTLDELRGMAVQLISAEPEATSIAIKSPFSFIPLRYHKARDGRIFPVEISSGMVTWKGKPALISIIRDISVRFEMEKALRKSEEAHRTLAGNIPAIVYRRELAVGGKTVFFNDMLSSVTGYGADDMRHGLEKIILPADLDEYKKTVAAALGDGRSYRAEFRVRRADGETRHLVDHGRPVPVAADGKFEYIDGVIFDESARKRAESEVQKARRDLRDKYSFHDIIGRSPAMKKVMEVLPVVSESDCSVLIEGPSGNGKKLIAKAIHDMSARKDRPFVTVSCGTIPETLLESELFGYSKSGGQERQGKIAAAGGGILFLDEIGKMPLSVQVRLLRFIEENDGGAASGGSAGDATAARSAARVIACSDQDLSKLVANGSFREDLYYRLRTVCLRVPALRERREDVELLVHHFISVMNEKYSKNVSMLTPRAFSYLMSYELPGNVRELQNIIEHSVIFCGGREIDTTNFPEEYTRDEPCYQDCAMEGAALVPGAKNELKAVKDSSEKAYILEILKRFDGSRKEASKFLNISRVELWRKMKKHRII